MFNIKKVSQLKHQLEAMQKHLAFQIESVKCAETSIDYWQKAYNDLSMANNDKALFIKEKCYFRNAKGQIQKC